MDVVTERIPYVAHSDLSGALGFDLEMANSFRQSRPVICMVGMEHYDAAASECVFTWASVTRRGDEAELVAWFVDRLHAFHAQHAHPRLVSFSGLDNDIPWLSERFERYGLQADAASALEPFTREVGTVSVNLSLKRGKTSMTFRLAD